MKEHCDYCTTVYDDNGDIVVWNCPKHAMVDEAIDYLRLAVSLIEQMLKGEGNRLDHETVYGAIARHYGALAKAEPQP